LRLKLYFCTLDKTTIFKQTVGRYIEIGETYSPDELLESWKAIYLLIALPQTTNYKIELTKLNAVQWTKSLFDVQSNKKATATHKILSATSSIKVKRTRPDHEDFAGLFKSRISF